MHVGIRELHNGLSKYLQEVRAGQTITITHHGTPIARIVPVVEPPFPVPPVAEGRLRPPKRRKRPAPIPIRADGIVSDLVADQRR